jgi:hypothetical protein
MVGVLRAINEVFHGYNRNQFPVVVLAVRADAGAAQHTCVWWADDLGWCR